MTDPNTPGHPVSPTAPGSAPAPETTPVESATDTTPVEPAAETTPVESAIAPEDRLDDGASSERASDAERSPYEQPVESAQDATAPAPDAERAPQEQAPQPASEQPATAEPASAERPLPPLSPPSSSAAPASAPSTGALHDDSALRAAEAARSGEPADPARDSLPATEAMPVSNQTGDLDDTRITPGATPRSTAAWTPPPAPASPAEFAPPTAATTPTPYAPPTQAMPTSATTPITSTTPLSNLGTSPADSLGFTDGIAGGDDGFTPEELAQRRSFRDEMAFRQKQEFAGINFGSAFFGWLAAVGLAGLLYVIVGGIAAASGLAKTSVIDGTATKVESFGSVFSTDTLQITALVVFLVILFLSYFVGGFVAARMARFSPLKQGLAVWLWGVVMTIITAVVLVVVASQNSGLSSLQPSGGSMQLSDFTSVEALVAEGLIIVLSLGGALVGGLAGLRYHRRIDRFGLEEV